MSVTVTLPDGSRREYDASVRPLDVAEDISPRLAKASLAAEVDGQLVDVTTTLTDGTHELRLLTDRDEQALEVLRHTTAHVMAQAVCNLWPGTKYTIGPALMDDFQYGFYYDFDLPESIGSDDLPRIEAEMDKIIQADLPIERTEMPWQQAKVEMMTSGQPYKVELIEELNDAGEATVSFYGQGDFQDLCRGPHLPSTGKVKAYKLLTTAGAYWRGDENNKMLTRIYGTAYFDKKQLEEHLQRVEEARKRDHRVLGKQLGLFMLTDEVGAGLPLWLPNGAIIRMELEGWLRGELLKRGYLPVNTPHIGKLDLWRTSGHYPYYEHGLYPTMQAEDAEDGYLLKPMNCPFHIQIYKSTQRSYRELPLRLSEFGQVYRFEQSGELSGLTRVRGFTQDDAHIFCTPEQLEAEIESCVELTKLCLQTLGLDDYRVRVGLRDPDSEKYTGSEDNWDQAEANIRNVVQKLGMNYTEEAGEAAFYGPKIDFVVKDCLGREWQLGTIQVDYNLPERFDLQYIGADNAPHRPVMVHRAPLGSPERFIGILIEHYAGAFPLWMSPVQIAVLPVSDKFNEYAQAVRDRFATAGLRVELDDSPEKVGAKIRRATVQKVPYMAIVGGREAEAGTVSLRHRTAGDLGAMDASAAAEALAHEVATKGADPVDASAQAPA